MKKRLHYRKHVRVLALVNQARKVLGYRPLKKLRKGIKRDSVGCPIFNSIPQVTRVSSCLLSMRNQASAKSLAKVWKNELYVGGRYVDFPDTLTSFVSNFDDGKYPELVKK